ncbi:hypothetical protein [Stutzerimonas nitrititolerans]|nr:hypothetical protein [Stutzerimonas nitrititolerans]HJE29436.1 hypothetical protein [Stutzerimonas nitrititolerans]
MADHAEKRIAERFHLNGQFRPQDTERQAQGNRDQDKYGVVAVQLG